MKDKQAVAKNLEKGLAKPCKDIPVYQWITLSSRACGGLEEAVKAINDAYKLGYAAGRKERGSYYGLQK